MWSNPMCQMQGVELRPSQCAFDKRIAHVLSDLLEPLVTCNKNTHNRKWSNQKEVLLVP